MNRPDTRPAKPQLPERRLQGLYSEDLALEWFLEREYLLLKRNLRRPRIGEVDLVLHRDRTIHAVEVKSIGVNCRLRVADPLCYASQRQLQRILKVMELWLGHKTRPGLLPDWDYFSIDLFTVDHRKCPPLLKHYPAILPPETGLLAF